MEAEQRSTKRDKDKQLDKAKECQKRGYCPKAKGVV